MNGVEEREELEERRAKLTLQLDEAIALKVAALFYSSWSSSSLYPDHKSFLITQPSKLRSQQHNNGNLPQIKNYIWRLQLTAAVQRWELPWKWREGAVLGGGRHQSAAHGGDQGDPREGGDFMFLSTFLRIINWQSLLTSIPGEVEGNSANSSVAIRGNCPSQLNRYCFLQISKVILFARSHSCVDNSEKNDSWNK